MTSTDKLVAALTEAGASPEFIARAKANYYHDFKSPLATPCIQLAGDLADEAARTGNSTLLAVRARHINGEFDATKEESEEWAASPEGQEIFRSFTRRPSKEKHDA